jgi:hypothetical protein
VSFNAQGRLTSIEVREHALTIGQEVAAVVSQNPTLRRSTRLR